MCWAASKPLVLAQTQGRWSVNSQAASPWSLQLGSAVQRVSWESSDNLSQGLFLIYGCRGKQGHLQEGKDVIKTLKQPTVLRCSDNGSQRSAEVSRRERGSGFTQV